MKCPECNEENVEGSLICKSCGAILNHTTKNSDNPSKANSKITYSFNKEKQSDNKEKEFEQSEKRKFFNDNIQISNDNQNIEKENKEEDKSNKKFFNLETISEEEIASENDNKINNFSYEKISLIILGSIALIISCIIFIKFPKYVVINKIISNLKFIIKSEFIVKALLILIYLIIILLLSIDSYLNDKMLISKQASKYITASFVISTLSIFVIDGISNLKNATIYINALIRFIILVIMSFLYIILHNFYNRIKQKLQINSFIFECLFYYDIITIILMIFFLK